MKRIFMGVRNSLALAIILLATAAAHEPETRDYQLQLGPHFLSPGNMEEPFLNLVKASSGAWQIDRTDAPPMNFGDALAAGYINEETGMPIALPNNARSIRGPGFIRSVKNYPDYYAGAYTLEWDGDAHGFLQGQPRDMQRRIGKNKLSFFVQPNKRNGRLLRFSELKNGGVTGIRLYRDENKKLIEAGEIWNPVFINYLKKYDVVRTMDFQATNASPVRSFDEVARPEDVFYGNGLIAQWPPLPRYGTPYEILFDLAKKADVKLWLTIPPMLGAPQHIAHPSFRLDNNEKVIDPSKVTRMARTNWREILDSPEWETFAAAFADRLIASDYPADKPLYIELGNEIWNWAAPFTYHTGYAHGIGRGMNEKWGHRQAYGVLTARFAAALEKEFTKRGVSYNVTYVIASQTAWPATTSAAITGFRYQLNQMGADSDAIFAKTGIALTTYSICAKPFSKHAFAGLEGPELAKAWEQAIDKDPEGLKRRYYDYCLNGPASAASTRPWILRAWRKHRALANKEGLRIIGAYEGGSHDRTPKGLGRSKKFKKWWTDYHWGPQGADVVRQVNLSIIEEFPGVILSNYVSMGNIGGAPWFDGHYSQKTDMLDMWDEFARPREQQ